MDTPNVNGPAGLGFQPNFGIGRLRNDQQRRNQRSFEEAFDEKARKRRQRASGTTVGSDNSADAGAAPDADARVSPVLRGLQHHEGFIRKDGEDGLLHIDVVV